MLQLHKITVNYTTLFRLLELTPGLDDYCENMFENGMEGMQEYCHMIVKATNTIVYMIHNTHWLKCLSSEMNFIEGVDIEGYYVSYNNYYISILIIPNITGFGGGHYRDNAVTSQN